MRNSERPIIQLRFQQPVFFIKPMISDLAAQLSRKIQNNCQQIKKIDISKKKLDMGSSSTNITKKVKSNN